MGVEPSHSNAFGGIGCPLAEIPLRRATVSMHWFWFCSSRVLLFEPCTHSLGQFLRADSRAREKYGGAPRLGRAGHTLTFQEKTPK